MRLSLLSLTVLALFTFELIGNDLLTQQNCSEFSAPVIKSSKYLIEGYTSITFGKTIGVDSSYSSIGLWAIAQKNDNLFFLDQRWNHLTNGDNSINIGTGVRFGDSRRGSGVNLYYDWRHHKSKDIGQISAGVEGWLCSWEFRGNIYLPIQNRFTIDRLNCFYPEGYEFRSKTLLLSCELITLTVGKRFNFCELWYNKFSLSPFAGPYWTSHSRSKHRFGALVGIDIRLSNLFLWKTLLTNDPLFKTRIETVLTLSIPFGCRLSDYVCGCFSSFYKPPERFPIIVIDKQKICQKNW